MGCQKEKIELLEELSGSYLLKDVLALERIRSSHTQVDLLKLIAFQVGSKVPLNEPATQVKLDVKTVVRRERDRLHRRARWRVVRFRVQMDDKTAGKAAEIMAGVLSGGDI